MHNHSPEYSLGDPFSPPLKNLMVGYPRTPYSWASSVSSVASTLPSRMFEPSAFSMPAALAYSGARALQWPHHGASGEHIQRFALFFVISVKHALMDTLGRDCGCLLKNVIKFIKYFQVCLKTKDYGKKSFQHLQKRFIIIFFFKNKYQH